MNERALIERLKAIPPERVITKLKASQERTLGEIEPHASGGVPRNPTAEEMAAVTAYHHNGCHCDLRWPDKSPAARK
jgi:hypothetical protein